MDRPGMGTGTPGAAAESRRAAAPEAEIDRLEARASELEHQTSVPSRRFAAVASQRFTLPPPQQRA
jgi:hypothetical protein